MICLQCAQPNAYRATTCGSCGGELPAFPPYVASNHVCQLQLAIAAFEEGRLTREQLLGRYANFADLAMTLDEKWALQYSLRDRLADGLRAQYGEGLAELDQAAAALRSALDGFDQWAEGGANELLGQVDEHLTDFFHHTCGGCAALLHALDNEPPPPPPSQVHDYGAV